MIFLLLITILFLAALLLLLLLLFLGEPRLDLLFRLAERLLPPSQRFLRKSPRRIQTRITKKNPRTILQSLYLQLLVAVVILYLRVLALLLLGLAVTVVIDAQTYGRQSRELYPFRARARGVTMLFSASEWREKNTKKGKIKRDYIQSSAPAKFSQPLLPSRNVLRTNERKREREREKRRERASLGILRRQMISESMTELTSSWAYSISPLFHFFLAFLSNESLRRSRPFSTDIAVRYNKTLRRTHRVIREWSEQEGPCWGMRRGSLLQGLTIHTHLVTNR